MNPAVRRSTLGIKERPKATVQSKPAHAILGPCPAPQALFPWCGGVRGATGGGGGGAREDTEGNSNHRPLRILGFQASFVPVPPRETPSWEPDFHRLANQGMAKNVTRLVSCDGRPSSPCAKTTPAQATPTRQALAAATPPAFPREAKRPLTPFATSRASRAVLESSQRTYIPGVAGVNFREQKSCLQTMQNFGAQRLRYCHKPWLKLSLRGGCPGRSRLRGRLPTPRSTDFSAAPGLLFPRLRADKSHACTRANETGRQQKPPEPPPNKEKEGKKASSIGEEKSERSAR